jgi:hypothetical protein
VPSPARTDDSGSILQGPSMRREDAEDSVILGTKDTTLDEALVEPDPCPLPETCHDTLGLLAFLLPHDGQSLVPADLSPVGPGFLTTSRALAHTLIGACDANALHQRELDQQGAAERHIHLGAGRCQLSGVVVRQLITTGQPQQGRRDHPAG